MSEWELWESWEGGAPRGWDEAWDRPGLDTAVGARWEASEADPAKSLGWASDDGRNKGSARGCATQERASPRGDFSQESNKGKM